MRDHVARITEKARLHAARAAFSKIRKDRELWEAAGIGPGDAYLALWSHLIEMRNYWQGAKTQERRDFYLMRYTETLKWLLPYEPQAASGEGEDRRRSGAGA